MSLDARVEKFLNAKRSDWHDWNVPYQDGKVLHDLIVHNKYIREFLNYVRSRPEYRTTIDRSSSSGISISYKNE